ncbi:hypothetical protein Elgi_40200 [Paenibacillus elgii]|nr:hypothetical protein Elgi_40200 [Paenibacillus elgii]
MVHLMNGGEWALAAFSHHTDGVEAHVSCMAAGRIGHTTGESQIPEGGVPMSRDNANNNGKKSQPGNNQDSEVAESKTKK